ncbi:MAG: HEAT repeat domain-containing protein [candidate division WOR-3 bacterium]
MLWLLFCLCPQEKDSLTLRLDSLFARASRWEVGTDADTARAARDTLIKMRDVTLDYIFQYKMNTGESLELRAMEVIFKGLAIEARPRLLSVLTHENDTVRSNAIYLVGQIKDTMLADTIASLLKTEKKPGVKRRAIYTLGELGLARSADAIKPYLSDTSERMRLAAVIALGKIKSDPAILCGMLTDKSLLVREAAETGLEASGSTGLLLERLGKSSGRERANYLKAMGLVFRKSRPDENESARARRAIFPLLDSPLPTERAWAAWALAPIADEGTRTKFALMNQTEADPFVLWCLEEALK